MKPETVSSNEDIYDSDNNSSAYAPPDESISQFEPASGDSDFDFVPLAYGETLESKIAPPKDDISKKVLSAEEYQSLRQQADSVEAIRMGLGSLGESLRVPTAPSPQLDLGQLVPQINEKELEDNMFNPGKSVQAVRTLMRSEMTPIVLEQMRQMSLLSKQILSLDPKTKDTFSKYEKEIEAEVATLPPAERISADVWKKVYTKVIDRHREDIINDEVNRRVEAALAQRGSSSQTGPGVVAGAKQASMYVESSGAAAPPRPSAKKIVGLTESHIAEMMERGIIGGIEDLKNPERAGAIAAFVKAKNIGGR